MIEKCFAKCATKTGEKLDRKEQVRPVRDPTSIVPVAPRAGTMHVRSLTHAHFHTTPPTTNERRQLCVGSCFDVYFETSKLVKEALVARGQRS